MPLRPREKLLEKDTNVSPTKNKPAFTIFQDSPSASERVLGHSKMSQFLEADKENELSKENLEPSRSSDLLNSDNIINNNILNCQSSASNQLDRQVLATKNFYLYPGFVEIHDQQQIASSAAQISPNKRHRDHVPRKSSPLKPVQVTKDENSGYFTPQKEQKEYSSHRSSKNSIFFGSSSSPVKSKITSKLIQVAASEKHNSSSESVVSRSSTSIKTGLSIPNLASLSPDKRSQIFRDPDAYSPSKKQKVTRSRSSSLSSSYSDSLASPSNSSNDAIHESQDLGSIRRLTDLWYPSVSCEAPQLSSLAKCRVNKQLVKDIPTEITPPRQLTKEMFNRLGVCKRLVSKRRRSFCDLDESKMEEEFEKEVEKMEKKELGFVIYEDGA